MLKMRDNFTKGFQVTCLLRIKLNQRHKFLSIYSNLVPGSSSAPVPFSLDNKIRFTPTAMFDTINTVGFVCKFGGKGLLSDPVADKSFI